MASGGPDWVRRILITVNVENVPVIEEPAVEAAAGGVGNYTGTDQTYQEVVSWTVTADKVGELKEILIISDDYAHTLAQITIGTTAWATNWSPTSAMPIIFEDLRLAAATEVKIEVKSSDGTSIDVDAIIVGKEVG